MYTQKVRTIYSTSIFVFFNSMKMNSTLAPIAAPSTLSPIADAPCAAVSAPRKAILNTSDFEKFKKSGAYSDIVDFVKLCAEAVVDSVVCEEEDVGLMLVDSPSASSNSVRDAASVSGIIVIDKFVEFMTQLQQLVTEIPPIKQPMRFGNKAFRVWHEQMLTKARPFLVAVCSAAEDRADYSAMSPDRVDELLVYIADMFGNTTRIDYGTGHELNFAVFFLMLMKLGLVQKDDLGAVVLRCFSSYVKTMRRLQVEYMLEPAGSHGVWGLDDYHCLLFLWGSAQLSRQDRVRRRLDMGAAVITPGCIHDSSVLREYAGQFLYLEGVAFIKQLKSSAPFAETSPMLNDISGLQDWAKICSGLMQLFRAEVLGKYPVIQHLLFGDLLRCTW